MTTLKTSWDVLIIGSGISSLTAATVLARQGKSVCILEKYRKPGGYMHCFNRYGHRFDTGAHYVGAASPGQPFHNLLTYLGVYDDSMFVELDRDGFDVMAFPSFEVKFKTGVENTIQSLTEIFPDEKEAIHKYFHLIHDVAAAFPTYEFDDQFDSSTVMEYMETPLSDIVEKLTENKKLRAVFYSYCSLHGVNPGDVGFGLHALVTDSLLQSAWGFKDGGDPLTQKFLGVLKSYGAEIHLSTEVTGFEIENGLVKTVQTKNEQQYTAEWIISGAHPKATFSWVGDGNLKPALKNRLSSIKESCGIFGIYAICENPPHELLKKNNFYVFDSEDDEDFKSALSPKDNILGAYISCTNRGQTAKTTTPLTIHAPVNFKKFECFTETEIFKRPQEYYDLKNEIALNILSLVKKRFPSLNILKFETSSPLSNIHYNGSIEGSSYGIYHSISATGVRALGPRTRIRNLLLTGQSTLFPGLFPSAISGLRTAGNIIGIKPLIRELKNIKTKSQV